MKKYLLAVLLLAGLNAKAQEIPFDIKYQEISFYTDSLDAVRFITLIDNRLDYTIPISNPLMHWRMDNNSIYIRKVGTLDVKKYARVKWAYYNNRQSVNIIEYIYVSKKEIISLYYNIREKEWSLMTIINRKESRPIKIYSMYQVSVQNKLP